MAILPASFTDRRRHQGELDRGRARRLASREPLSSDVQVNAIVVGRPATALLLEALLYADALRIAMRDGRSLSVSHVFRASSWIDATAIARRSSRCVVIADDDQALPDAPLWDGRGNDVSVLTAEFVLQHSCRPAPQKVTRSIHVLRRCKSRTEKLASLLRRVHLRRWRHSGNRIPVSS